MACLVAGDQDMDMDMDISLFKSLHCNCIFTAVHCILQFKILLMRAARQQIPKVILILLFILILYTF